MKQIKISQNKYTQVDDSDFEELNKYKWMAKKDKKNFYVARHSKGGTRKLILMHRVVANTPNGMFTDHIDGDGLNNQKSNLRVCSNQQNSVNRGKNNNNTSGLKGVYWVQNGKSSGKWRALIGFKGKFIHLGLFSSKEAAYEAYCTACCKLHGDFAKF
jgi:hypothetical protein